MSKANLNVVANNGVTIDKGIPMPSKGASKYPWRTMEVGDSFLFPPGLPANSAYTVARQGGNATGRKFVARSTEGGLRCWRTA